MTYDLSMLTRLGISHEDATALRRISMTLHRWHELECGDGNNYSSWCVVRGHKAPWGEFTYNDNGAPHLERHFHDQPKARYEPIADRERGAQKRLGKIMTRYPGLVAYVQTDPRGAALYILRSDDIAKRDVTSCYSIGVAVFK